MVELKDNSPIDLLEKEIQQVLRDRRTPKPLYDMMRYHLGWLDENLKPVDMYRGKRFRPLLCLLSYHALSKVYDKALPAAAAIELIHNFSLIHDDIEDRDEERRHKPTVWKLWGDSQAINAGDGMHVLANLAALRLREKNVTDSKIVDILGILNDTVMKLCEGQFLDISFEERTSVSTEEYLDMIYRKTGALIESAVLVGAILGTEDKRIISNFRKFGKDLGMAFQIRDDIIGTWGVPENTGKPTGSDILNRKKTLPVIYTLERSSGKERHNLLKIYEKEELTKRDLNSVMNYMKKAGAYRYATSIASDYEKSAMKSLKKLKLDEEAGANIMELYDFLIHREY